MFGICILLFTFVLLMVLGRQVVVWDRLLLIRFIEQNKPIYKNRDA
jgi:hypothetical protein